MFVQRSLRRSARLAARVSTPMSEWLKERQPSCCHNVRIGNQSDLERLARLLSGSAIALVLGGGGARGFAHVGVLRALAEAGVPIDMIGGTSQGAFVGALYAMSLDVDEVVRRCTAWAAEMSKKWKLAADLTFPFTSWLSGAGFNWELGKVLGGFSLTESRSRADVQIEDLWTPYFCVSANLCRNRVEVHTRGALWRYVRASMTLASFLPPIYDRETGDLLVDGGYVNNLPADVMRGLGAHIVITVDVASVDDNEWTAYGDSLSGWWQLWQLLWPFGPRARLPSASEVQSRLAYISSYTTLEDAR
jgi:lysophospholipid hydrolase